jgi:hypothetical protein
MVDEWADENGWDNSGGSAGNRSRFDWMGADRDRRGPSDGDADSAGSPDVPPYGMTSEQLYAFAQTFCNVANSRILREGAQQYDRGSVQKFEDMTPVKIVAEIRAELMDIVNYAAMLDIQMARMIDGINEAQRG